METSNSKLTDVVIVGGIRTPFAKANTALKSVHAAQLGAVALRELLYKIEIDADEVQEVIIGNIGNPIDTVNIARVIALNAGLPKSISAHTVHRNCASALESIATGFDKIKAGMADVVIAGGTESMSQIPLVFQQSFTDIFSEFVFAKTIQKRLSALSKIKLKYLKPRIALMEGLTDPFCGLNMGQTAEVLAKEFHISRKEQDEFALQSHQRAIEAQKSGRLAEEMTPVFVPPEHKIIVEKDVGPRENQTLEALAKLRPFFDRKYGTVTAGNACSITDGAAMVMLMTRSKAQELGIKPLVTIRSYGFCGLDPERMGLGPVYSTALALKRTNLSLKDIGLIELNEAFAAQVLACKKAFEDNQFCRSNLGLKESIGTLDLEKLNVNGGAIALGHPVGATGSRLVLTLMTEMLKRSDVRFGLATLCIGGGQGGAMILEREH